MFCKIFCTKCLYCKTHIHNLCRMPITCCKVYKTPLCKYIYCNTIWKFISHNVITHLFTIYGNFTQAFHINFNIKMACITKDCTFFHLHKVFFINDTSTACNCYKEITMLCCLFHRHYLKPVHYSLYSLNWVNFCNNDTCPKSLCPH